MNIENDGYLCVRGGFKCVPPGIFNTTTHSQKRPPLSSDPTRPIPASIDPIPGATATCIPEMRKRRRITSEEAEQELIATRDAFCESVKALRW